MDTRGSAPKVLVLRFSSLGDLVLMTPLLSSLRRGLPGGTIHLACKEQFMGLFEGGRVLDRLHTLPEGGYRELFELWSKLRKEHFDIVIDAHNVIRSNILYHTLRAPRKLQLTKEHIRKGMLIRGKRNLYGKIVHQTEGYLDLARRLGIEEVECDPSLEIPDTAALRAQEFIEGACMGGRTIVAIAPGARWETKRWPLEWSVQTARALANDNIGIVLVGGADDEELAGTIASSVSPPIPNAAGALSILETAALLRSCRLLITNDSAALHLAEAVSTPVVAIFGPTVREFGYFPRLPRSIMLEADLPCRPCSRNGAKPCPLGTKECLTAITPDAVLDALRRVLAAGGSGTGVIGETKGISE
ncbi:MAG: glycosyltransferase family 9 protein [bacterium]|nr:MAG: glycosyltransferase family 9 protein [bacterium]